jgi:hypothetical protein
MDGNSFQDPAQGGILPTNNVMQLLGGDQTLAPSQMPSIASAAGSDQLSAPQHGGRQSLFDIIGRVGDMFAKIGGSTPLYQSTMDADLARQQAAEDRPRQVDLENLKAQLVKSQIGKANSDAADAQGKLDTAHAALIGAGAKGLRAVFAKSGADGVNRAWPLVAQQLHLSPEDTQTIGQHLQQDPDTTISALEATAAKATSGKDGNEYGLVPIYTRDAQGNLHVRLPSKSGEFSTTELPNGEVPVDPGKAVDLGDRTLVYGSKSNNPQMILPHGGKPAEGTRPIVGPDGQINGYTALPLTDTSGNVVGSATDAKGAAADVRKQAANSGKNYATYKAADNALADLDKSLADLRNDPNLADATGLVGGNLNLTPAQRTFHGRVEAVIGQSIPAAIAAIRGAGGAAPRAVSEIMGEAKGLTGAISDRNQPAAAYAQQIDEARARLRQRRLEMAQEFKANSAPAAPAPAAPVMRRTPQKTVRSPSISNW